MSLERLHLPETSPLREFHGMFSQARQMDALFVKVERIARADCTVQILGETGSGKELVAHAIHAESPRRQGPFRAVNSATLSPTLLESELFGHRRGSFTGAIRDFPGLFALADTGTLLLDEVSEIPFELQGKLLRVLQEKSFLPIGATQPVAVDVRVISTSNKLPEEEVASGRFRADLNYRLRVAPIYVPPLRARTGDIPHLVWHFVKDMNRRGARFVEAITTRAMAAIESYSWPGNVRELHSLVEYATIVGEGPVLDVGDLTPEVSGTGSAVRRRERTTREERERIMAALEKHGGHKSAAASELGISRQTLWRKLYALGLA